MIGVELGSAMRRILLQEYCLRLTQLQKLNAMIILELWVEGRQQTLAGISNTFLLANSSR